MFSFNKYIIIIDDMRDIDFICKYIKICSKYNISIKLLKKTYKLKNNYYSYTLFY